MFNWPKRFKDRYDAARQLLTKLTSLSDFKLPPPGRARGKTSGKVVIMAIPRGALELGSFLAKKLKKPLEVGLVKKIPAPGAPELAIGAIALDGGLVLDERLAQEVGADKKYLEDQKNFLLTELKRRDKIFHERVPALPLQGKDILLVDDGIATGQTVRASIEWLRRQQVKKIIVAAPVVSAEAAEEIKKIADGLVVLRIESPFYAVGLYYERFPQVSDDEAVTLLEKSR